MGALRTRRPEANLQVVHVPVRFLIWPGLLAIIPHNNPRIASRHEFLCQRIAVPLAATFSMDKDDRRASCLQCTFSAPGALRYTVSIRWVFSLDFVLLPVHTPSRVTPEVPVVYCDYQHSSALPTRRGFAWYTPLFFQAVRLAPHAGGMHPRQIRGHTPPRGQAEQTKASDLDIHNDNDNNNKLRQVCVVFCFFCVTNDG